MVQVRCRSPWFSVGALIKALDEAPEQETPPAAAAAAAAAGGTFGPTPSLGGTLPPPPPPRTTSSSFESLVQGLFLGEGGGWGGAEPLWYYIDRSDSVQVCQLATVGSSSTAHVAGWVHHHRCHPCCPV